MSASRITKTRVPADVPDLGNPDRKRVLNVLAQRRYRQRRREKIAALEAQSKSLESLIDHRSASSDNVSPQASTSSENSDIVQEFISVPCEDHVPSFAMNEDSFDTDLIEDLSNFPSLPTPLPSTPDLIELRQPSLDGFAFPLTADSGVLSMPVMTMVQAFLSIATSLNVCDNLWDPSYMHVLPASSSYPISLPPNLYPVPAQLCIPHHPALDLLPWPSMREKLICMLALPSKLRPKIAQEDDEDEANMFGSWPYSAHSTGSSPASQSKAVTQLVQDLDDFEDGGGLRVHGNSVAWGQGNEFVEEAWEVGEHFYRKWWFCLDQKIVDQTNRRRRERGLRRLRIEA